MGCYPVLRQPNSTASSSIPIRPRHHPFSTHQPLVLVQPQFVFSPIPILSVCATNRSGLINSLVPKSSYYASPITASTASDSPAKALRRLLESPGIHQGPACFDALSAKLIERAGFGFCFTSGFPVSAARLGLLDVGLISYGEMVDQG